MSEFFRSGLAVDIILMVVVLECVALTFWPRLRGGMTRLDIASLVLPGVFLLLALRNALTGGPYITTAAILAAAFISHLWDVSRRRDAARH